jgi:hypothetical protein
MNEHQVGEIWVDLHPSSSNFGSKYKVLEVKSEGITATYVDSNTSNEGRHGWTWSVLEKDIMDESTLAKKILKQYE